MIDIPLGKALVPVESISCDGCYFAGLDKTCMRKKSNLFLCQSFRRSDEKSVIFKLVDYPVKE